MRIVHVIGSEGAAYRLHLGLRRMGIDSRMLVAQRRTDDPHVTVFIPPRDLPSRARRRLRRHWISRGLPRYTATRPEGYGYFFDDRCVHGGDMTGQLPPCDLVHLHSMYGLVDFRDFFTAVPRRVPVVRTLHDMSFFTGGCHHDWGCGAFTARCGACPQLGSHRHRDLSREIWQRKRDGLRAVPANRLHLVAPSRWLAETARKSSLLQALPISVIPLGLDTDVFRPRDRRVAREVLGIPQDTQAVLFVGDPLDRPEKGFALLAAALEASRPSGNVLLLSVGGGALPCRVAVPHLRLGRIASERVLSLVYSAADLSAVPSVQDNFPYAALESLACATPVVGFTVGGLPEIVRTGVTGRLVPPRDVRALGAAIAELMHQPARRAEMGACCRRIAAEEYRLDIQARRYAELYAAMLAERRTADVPARRFDSRLGQPARRMESVQDG